MTAQQAWCSRGEHWTVVSWFVLASLQHGGEFVCDEHRMVVGRQLVLDEEVAAR